MTHANSKQTRRHFLRGGIGLLGLPIVGLVDAGGAVHAAERPKLDPQSQQAQALAYVHEAAKASGHDAYQQGANCGNCIQWTGGDKAWGGCNIFPGKRVARAGWCSVWTPKP
jgi:hypothetical protein